MEPRCGWFIVLLLITTDFTYSAASSCKTGCQGQNNNVLKLQEGTTYVYNLEGNTETSVPKTKGPNGDSTKLSIKAQVEVSVQPQCATLIRLKKVQVTGPDDKKFGNLNKLEENPLRVNLNGGVLSPQVCVVSEDDYTSLNIKRAVASLLQINTAESTTIPQEVDVFGSCPTNYNVQQESGVTVVRKTRNLNQCSYRENIRQEIFAIPSGGNSELQSSPLLDPTFEAEIRIKDGIVQSALAKESYLLRPFSDRTNGARTKITTKLTFEKKSSGAIPDTTKQPRSIIFENPHEVVSSSIQSVLAALHKVADNAVGTDAAKNVAELVSIIRRASADDLLSVYGQVKAGAGFKNKNLAKKVFTDALFRSGSGDSISVAVELLKSREITGNEAKLWYLSFALSRHASSSALEKAATLLDDANLPREAYLGIGALAGKYCREHLCENVPQFETLLKKLAGPLATPIPASRNDETKVIGSLKSLRNVKKLTDEVAGKVAAVIAEPKAPTRVRVAALETAVSDACKNKLQKAAADVLNNKEEDSELRIKAYLVLVECPNAKTANKLSELLETENVNQVGAFITAHLRNLRASAKPERQSARALLQNVKPRRRYPIDVRKFSQNYEISYDIDALSSSASLESNVIFSQKSYLPRSANLNLTAEVFGHAFNLFEINGRAENLERVVERYLGPKGYVRNTKPEDIFKDGQSELKTLKEYIEGKYRTLTRSRRSVTRKNINSFGAKTKLKNSELDDNVDVDISLRLLGNELVWVNLDEKAPNSPESVIDKVVEVLERGFGKVKDFDHHVQNHAVFLDTELAYPTASGLPLKLTATGTSVVHLKLAGSLDLAALLKNPKNGEAKIEIRPSASIEVVGQLSIDGYAVETGVKVAGTLHTATGSEIAVKFLDGEGVDVNIGLPIKESDILTVSSEVLVTVRERGQTQNSALLDFQVPRNDLQGCFDQLLPFIGLTLCGKVGFPNDPTPLTTGAALYPLNGHSKLSLRLDKEDESLKTYHFRLQYSLKDPTNRRIHALIDTPGSNNPREISVLAEAKTLPNKEISIKVVTPIYKFKTQALVTDTNSEYTLSGLAELEGLFSYKARLGLLINGATYTPILEYTPTDGSASKQLKVEGTVTVDKSGPTKRTYTFNHVRAITTTGQYSVDGTISKDTNLFQTDLKLGYDKETVGIKTKLQRQGDDNLKLVLEISPSQYPDFGFGIKYEYQRDKTHLQNSLSVVHGPDLTSKQNRLNVFQQITFKVESIQQFDVSTKNTLSYPLLNIEGTLEGAATHKSVHYELLLGYASNKITSKLNAKTGIAKPGDYSIDFSASAFEHGVHVEAKGDKVGPNKSKFSNVITLTPGGKYSLDASVTHQLEKNNIDTRLELVLKLEGSNEPYRLDIGAVLNPSNLEAHSKVGVGASDIIDAEIKQHRVEPLSGSFHLNIRKAIISKGEYRKADNKATASIVIELLPISRKIKGSADLTATGPKHVGTIEILYDADKDPSKKLVVKTETDLTGKSINSKNKIQEGGREVIINFNGEANGKLTNGGVSGGYDITLPNGLHLVARAKQALNIVPSNSNGELFVEVGYSTQKGIPLTKLTLDTYARNVDLKRHLLDTKFDVIFSCENGDAYYKQSVKSSPNDGKTVIEAQNSLGGSRLGEHQYNGKAKVTVGSDVTYHVTGTLGQKYSLDTQGKVHPIGEDRTQSLENTLVLKSNNANTPKEIKQVLSWRYVHGDESRPCQLKLSEELTIDGKSYKISSEGQGTKKDGNLKLSLGVSDSKPYNAQFRYKHNHESDIVKSEVGIDADHGDKKINLNVQSDYTKSLTLINTHVTGSTPFESLKKIDATLHYKKVSAVAGTADLKLALNDENTDVAAKWDFTTNHIVIDTTGNVNGGKYRFYYKLDRKNDRHGVSEGQVIWASNGGGQYDWNASADLESLENFAIILKLHSEKLNINKLKIEFGNHPTKAGAANKVNIGITNKDGKILVGSASYAIKDSEGGYSVEGKGTVTIGNDNYPLTYKLTEERLAKNANNEVGRHIRTQVDFVKGSFNQEFKLSDKELRYDTVICWDKKCLEQALISSLNIDDLRKSNSQTTLKAINNLPQFPAYNLLITNKAERDGFLGNTETVVTIQDTTYSIRAYAKTNDAGIVVNVPTREIAAIANYQYQKNDGITGKLDASLYLDHKKNPTDKATVTLEAGVTNKNQQAVASASAKFSHPKLQRDLSVKSEASVDFAKKAAKARFEADVYSKKSQKVAFNAEVAELIVDNGRNYTATAVVLSKGLTLDLGASAHAFANKEGASVGAFAYYVDDKSIKKDTGVSLSVSRKHAAILVRVPGHTLVDGSADVTENKDVRTLNGKLTISEGDTAVIKATLTGLQELKASISPQSNPKRSLSGLVGWSNEKLEAKLERQIDGKTENLVSGIIHLDDANLFKVDYDVSAESIKKSVQYFEKLVKDIIDRTRAIAGSLTKELNTELIQLSDALKSAQPDFKPLIEQYQKAFKTIRDELEKDKNYQKLAGVFKKVFGGSLDAIEAQIKIVLETYEKVGKELTEIQVKLVDLYKKISPDLIETFKKVVEIYTDLAKNVLEAGSSVVQQILDLIREHEKDIKLVINNLTQSFQDVGRVTFKSLNQFRQELRDLITLLVDQFKSLPIYNNAKDRIQELLHYELPPHFWELYQDLNIASQEFLPTPELKKLSNLLFTYVEKKLKRQAVDDVAELSAISKQAVETIEELISLIKTYFGLPVGGTNTVPFLGYNVALPLPATSILKLPELGNIRFSPLALLASINDLPAPLEYLFAYRPTINPLDQIPPFKAYAVIIDSHHFITFDKKHLSFHGTCSYVLAQDFQDGNFSIVANLDNGAITSITLADKTDIIEILSDNTVVFNGKAGDLPINTEEVNAWRRYHAVNIKLKAGVFVTKYVPQNLYVIRVSGFYFGRTRGLLGTINNEQYDEFILPDGHLAKDSTEFTNAYRLKDSCAPAAGHHHAANAKSPECTALFTSDSSLRNYFGALSPEPYREACEEHVSMTKASPRKAACDIAAAYVKSLRYESIPFASVPSECAQCTVAGKTLELGQSEEVKSPVGKADVVLVVEQSTQNAAVFKDLVAPLIANLQADLKGKQINDVEFALIGYGGPHQSWPQHYGSKGKVTYDGKGENIQFADAERLTPPYDTLLKKIKLVKKFIDVELGREQIVTAMTEANHYPFRQGAAKIVILINTTPCSRSPLFPFSLQLPRTINIYRYYREHGLDFYIVSPLAGLALEKPDGKSKSVVGFDSENVYYLGDTKGVPADRAGLSYEDDLCLSFSQYYGGAAFSSQNLISTSDKKTFVEGVSNRIVKGALKYSTTEDCTCTLKNGFQSRTECTVASRELKGR